MVTTEPATHTLMLSFKNSQILSGSQGYAGLHFYKFLVVFLYINEAILTFKFAGVLQKY